MGYVFVASWIEVAWRCIVVYVYVGIRDDDNNNDDLVTMSHRIETEQCMVFHHTCYHD